jgi:beta-galactosidase/beta-glucuronidase
MCYLPASRDLSAQKSNDEHLPWAAANTSTADTTSRGLALAESMVWRDAHHPAIVMWSAGNERPADQEPTAREIRVIISRLKSLDATRPVTAVSNRGGSDRSLAECDVLCLNEYTGVWGAPFATDTRVLPAMARALSRRLDSIHKLHPDKPVIISEFGCPVFPVPGNRFGSLALQAGLFRVYGECLAAKPWIIGGAAWCWTDQRINGFTHYPPGALGTVELEVFGLTDLRGKARPALRALASIYRRLASRSPAG